MASDQHILPFLNIVPVPWLDESLASIATRVAINNYYTSARIVAKRVEEILSQEGVSYSIGFPTRQLLWWTIGLEGYQHLATLFRISEGRLRATALPEVAMRYMPRSSFGQFCPHCLEEDSYHRNVWLPRIMAACTRHACLLIDRCPQCHRELLIEDIVKAVCHRCSYELRTARSVSIAHDISGVRAQQCLEEWLGGAHNSGASTILTAQPFTYIFDIFDWLYALIEAVTPQWSYMHWPTSEHERIDRWPKPFLYTPTHRYALSTTTVNALIDWPESFTAFLAAYLDAPRWKRDSGGLYMIIDTWPFQHVGFQFVWDAFDPFLAEAHYPLQWCVYNDNIAFTRPFGFISLAKAAEMLHVVPEMIGHFIYLGVLRSQYLVSDRLTFVNIQDVHTLQDCWWHSLSVMEAAEWLQCDEPLVIALVEAQLLIQEPQMGRSYAERASPLLRIQRASVVALLTAVLRQEVEWTEGPVPTLISLAHAVTTLFSHIDMHIVDVIQRIVDGDLLCYRERNVAMVGSPWYHTSKKQPLGIDAIELDYDALREYCHCVRKMGWIPPMQGRPPLHMIRRGGCCAIQIDRPVTSESA